MTNTKKILYFYLPIILFMVAPFTLSYNDTDSAEIFSAAVLPPEVASIASGIRWFSLSVMALNGLFILKKEIRSVSRPVILLTLFYAVQLVYALVDGFDIPRFFGLSVLSFLIPLHLSLSFKYYGEKLLNLFTYSIGAFLFISLALNGKLILMGQRFLGFINNANLYGLTAVFWSVILIIKLKSHHSKKNIFNSVLLAITILTIIMTGSRNAFVAIALVLGMSFHNRMRHMILLAFLLILVLFILGHFLDLSFVEDRLFNIANSAKDSGRDEIWGRAYKAISENFYTGNGMNANVEIANSGNMHNCYIRFLLNMGIIFTVLSVSVFLLSIFFTFKFRKFVPMSIVAFLFAYFLANFGEDYYVGVGSSMFVYILYIYGLINYYLMYSPQIREIKSTQI